jgi:excisionase family DNA binding protein
MDTQTNTESQDIITATELAAMLRMHPVTIRLKASSREIPGRQVGNRWRFSRKAITEWLSKGP